MATQRKQSKAQAQIQKGKGKATAQKTRATQSTQAIHEEEKHRLIEEAAYFIAERRGFQGDMGLDDWLQAEKEVNARGASTH
jgi:antibiotic biosynthesis monooxygenase (ABM) superfamily enzyme